MARARNIKPGFFKNEILGVADPLYSLLFEGLWVLADRAGRLEDRPLRIKGEIFPYRDGLDVDNMLHWLQDNGFIQRYTSAGKKCILVLEFVKHQNPHKNETESELPAPALEQTKPDAIGTTSEIIGSTRADSLSSDSPTTDSLIPDPLAQSADAEMPVRVLTAGEVCIAMKAQGIGDVNPGHLDLTLLLEAGAQLPEFVGAATSAALKHKGFAYAIAIVKRERQDAAATAKTLHQGAMPQQAQRPQPKTFAERDREAGWARWEQMTNQVHPDRIAAQAQAGSVIDVTPRYTEIAQ